MTPCLGTARSRLRRILLLVQVKWIPWVLVLVKVALVLLAMLVAIGLLLSRLSIWLVSVNIRARSVLRPVSVIIGLKESSVVSA